MSKQNDEPASRAFSRRRHLIYELVMEGVPWFVAQEAVATTAIEHPEWDMDEEMTWSEWHERR